MQAPIIAKYKDALQKLVRDGEALARDISERRTPTGTKLTREQRAAVDKVAGQFEIGYQRWYTEALAVIRQLLPDRAAEFASHYHADARRKTQSGTSFVIQDWLLGVRSGTDALSGKKHFDDHAAVAMRMSVQLQILQSAEARFDSALLEIRQVLTADLFESELDGARELAAKGFLRAGGVLAGVVVEKHLAGICDMRSVAIRKKHPAIADFNDALKSASVLDVPTWRQIQRLADIRNLCAHGRDREPTSDEVLELIGGADKITKTVY